MYNYQSPLVTGTPLASLSSCQQNMTTTHSSRSRCWSRARRAESPVVLQSYRMFVFSTPLDSTPPSQFVPRLVSSTDTFCILNSLCLSLSHRSYENHHRKLHAHIFPYSARSSLHF